jgi:hypothetical protein
VTRSIGGPDHYILLCANRYATAISEYRKADEGNRQLIQSKLDYLLESGRLEVEAEQRRRECRLVSDIRVFVRDRKPLNRAISGTEAKVIRHFYAIPPAPLLNTLAGEELKSLGNLFEQWAQERDRRDLRTMIELLGWSEGMRILAQAVGDEYVPLTPPEQAPVPLIKFLARRVSEHSQN